MTKKQNTSASVTVSIVGGPSMTVAYTTEMNAQQAMEAAFNSLTDPKFDYALQYYGAGLGNLVVMINDTYESFISSSKPFYFWEFLVNGQPASVGVDKAILQPGDAVSFEFVSFSSETPAHSTLHAKYKLKLRK
jgi:hypothetical protein